MTKISKVFLKDLNNINLIASGFFKKNNLYSLDELTKFVKNKDCIFLKITNNNEIIGYTIAYYLTDHIDIYQIAINKQYQNSNYGTLLIDYLKQYKLDLFAEATINNTNVLNFYLKNKFKQIKVLKKYYNNCDDGILLVNKYI